MGIFAMVVTELWIVWNINPEILRLNARADGMGRRALLYLIGELADDVQFVLV